jgi:hypothetical protein
MSDVFEVSYVFHRNDVGRLQIVTVDIKRIHFVDIVSIGIEIYIVVSNTYCVVFLFCLSSSCVLYVASFSGLFIFDCPFGVL